MLQYTIRPISDRTHLGAFPVPSRFTVTWTQALDLLEREYNALNGEDLVIEIDVTERDIRNDGLLRANARPTSHAIRVAFTSKHGPLQYACDQYVHGYRSRMSDWQHNVYAVALTLEALRSVDRYGATKSGEQYRGYRQIGSEPHSVAPSFATKTQARDFLVSVVGFDGAEGLSDTLLVRRAARATHPDMGGSVDQWNRVQDASRLVVS